MKTISLELEESGFIISDYAADKELIICREWVHEYFEVPDDYEKIWLTLSTEVLKGGYETYRPRGRYTRRSVVLSNNELTEPYDTYNKLDRTINKLEGLDDQKTVWMRIEYV